MRVWIKTLATNNMLDDKQTVVIRIIEVEESQYDLEIEANHGTIAGVWPCPPGNVETARVLADLLEAALTHHGYNILPEWPEEGENEM